MGVDLSPHKYEIDEATGKTTIKRVKPYRMFVSRGKPTVFLQGGKFYYSQEDISPIPDDELRKLGFDLDAEEAPTSMPPDPRVTKIIKQEEEKALENWAKELVGAPSYRRK